MPPQTGLKTDRVMVNLTPSVRAELEKIAGRQEISLAQVIRQAIRFYLVNGAGG